MKSFYNGEMLLNDDQYRPEIHLFHISDLQKKQKNRKCIGMSGIHNILKSSKL